MRNIHTFFFSFLFVIKTRFKRLEGNQLGQETASIHALHAELILFI
jgi:hypothetical protein